MSIMIVSKNHEQKLYAFVFGYARKGVREDKQIFSFIPLPLLPVLFIIAIILLIWFLLNKRREKDEIELKYYLTWSNEGIVISDEQKPGLLNGRKKDIAKLIGIAVDRHIVRHGEVPNHIFFILDKKDLDVFSDEVLEAIGDKQVWLFIEDKTPERLRQKLEKIGKLILFDPVYMKDSGNPDLDLGIVTRFLSLIPRESDTNLDHIYQGIPDRCTISYNYPVDIHHSLASVLKHQKFFSMNHGEDVMQITNTPGFAKDTAGPVKLVKADTEPFFIRFKEVL